MTVLKDLYVEPIANYHCICGECPRWDAEREALYWIDIPAGKFYRYLPKTGKHECLHCGDPIGGYTLQADGSLLLFQVNRITRLHLDGRTEKVKKNIDEDMERFNDVVADPKGRVFAGTIGREDGKGGLYRIDPDGTVTVLFKGTRVSNGMGFSPNRKTFYWTCSSTRQIFQFDYDEETGEIGNQRLFVAVAKEDGIPDGLAVDRDGAVWSARWNGHAVHKYSPEGKELGVIKLPVPAVSSLTFGGKECNELYVTTAHANETPGPAEGSLYRIRVPFRGQPEYRSRVLMD